ncbi:MAG: radical SAM protein [Syntrophothermus sp.]
MKIFNRIADRYARIEPLPAGMYHLQTTLEDVPYRLHLRLNRDGTGLLIVNASTVLQLNPTAAEYAYQLVKGSSPEEAAGQIAARYRVNKGIARQDYNDFVERVQALIRTPDLDPVSILNFELATPRSADLTAPLRLDCALTYRLNPETSAEYAPVKRASRELTTEEWKSILDRAWEFGIPQITFTGGEATLREDLPDLIAEAEKNGQVCGLLTDGLRLRDKAYLSQLLQTGLDHILFLLQPENQDSWQALEAVLIEDIFVTVHITLNPTSIRNAEEDIKHLAALGVRNLSLTTSDDSLSDAFHALRNTAAEAGLTLRFDLPVPYSAYNPVAIETHEDDIPKGAGRVWMYVEPDGDVLPSQRMADRVLGSLLTDAWSAIYPPRI